ncbi:MAG: hypothetical protein ACRCXZ_03315 [Patescibacteria group bacterium]
MTKINILLIIIFVSLMTISNINPKEYSQRELNLQTLLWIQQQQEDKIQGLVIYESHKEDFYNESECSILKESLEIKKDLSLCETMRGLEPSDK